MPIYNGIPVSYTHLYYELSDKLAVGEVTNMYDIAEKMAGASLIVSP